MSKEPKDLKTERIIIPMDKMLIERIDDFRFSERLPSRAEAIRALIEAGLQVKQSGKDKK